MASKGKGYRTIERDGWEILVGKGASDNDELSLKIAEPLDYWFHVDDYSGSHKGPPARPTITTRGPSRRPHHGAQGREIPSRCMRDRNVLGLRPRRSAAPPVPLTFQFEAFSASRICVRSMA